MGILGGSQNQVVSFEDVQKARVAFDDGGNEFDDQLQDSRKRVRGGNALADLMQDVDVLVLLGAAYPFIPHCRNAAQNRQIQIRSGCHQHLGLP